MQMQLDMRAPRQSAAYSEWAGEFDSQQSLGKYFVECASKLLQQFMQCRTNLETLDNLYDFKNLCNIK